MSQIDWLSQFLEMITITGQLEVRYDYSAPWRVVRAQSGTREIPYLVVLNGKAVFEEPEKGTSRQLVKGDIVLLPHGTAHVVHGDGGDAAGRTCDRPGIKGCASGEKAGQDERLAMLCGRFFVGAPHERLIRNYLPMIFVTRAVQGRCDSGAMSAANRLARVVELMRVESCVEKSSGYAIFNTLSPILFALALRAGSESKQAPAGLLALAGHARLGPAISAMFADPARPWSLPDLADLCGMSRATFMRHFQDRLGRSAFELLTDIRMGLAANGLKKTAIATEALAESVGYRSVAAFRRVFSGKMGMTPAQWRRLANQDR